MKCLFILLLNVLPTFGFAEESMWVHAAKAQVKTEAKMNATTVLEVKRGDELQILKKEGLWFEVKKGKSQGWISKLFVNNFKPVGSSELLTDVKPTEEKASRRRSSSYAVSASTRGLTPEMRVREGREEYQTNFEALEEIELLNVDPAEFESFQKSGKLSGY